MIYIEKHKNPDYGYETAPQLLHDTQQHRLDVQHIMSFVALNLYERGLRHDWTKTEFFDEFAKDTLERLSTPEFKKRDWYQIHTNEERHHLNARKPEDINLIDVIEFISDCIAAGLARSGEVKPEFLEIPPEMLQEAFDNTIQLILDEIELYDENSNKVEFPPFKGDD